MGLDKKISEETEIVTAAGDEQFRAIIPDGADWLDRRIGLAAIATYITAAITDSAPGTLDTLNELAAALGDDPNFAATTATALAGKQPLDSELTAFAALVSAANKLGYFTSSGTMGLVDFEMAAVNTSHTPTVTASSGTLGGATPSCSYLRIGKYCMFSVLISGITAGSGTGTLQATLPFTAAAFNAWIGEEYAVSGVPILGRISGGSNLLRLTAMDGATSIIATGNGVRLGGAFIIS